ncbi:CubicO group peptidase (beta-lactamase class C family) [Altererythrobacter atlanticus]|uniref:D-alanyl-D-alanine carboxypeptidase n=1 Tax=Croceibacterium atlanticum TaxID=1267766 RepID=A0A0F7KRH0_9SPHN|nr:serine hydrolase domain-containing protein [Croceibacterium atlanticum]AKH41807.1 D-alanyl-D-alanine carboxypeptidase precursor [Croceibacterium atlanticum]MBB5733273.1 CubicO group peptidase (beta-lactamase class C family) [Croceibacterium atlanticum]
MHRLLAIFALALCSIGQAAGATGSIDSFIAREMAQSGAPGIAYAVVENGEIAKIGTRGVEDRDTGKKVTGDTQFLIGSLSKSFTALAIMQLVEAGKVELDAPISRYLGSFADGPAQSITIRQLLSHTSGYSTLQGNYSHQDRSNAPDELARQVERDAAEAPAYPAESRYEYSNRNYQILGRLVEVASGQDFASYVSANILRPIGMDHSFVSDGAVHPEMATGYAPWFTGKRAISPNQTHRSVAPQGGIVSTARDIARYMQVMMNGEDDVLSAAGKAQMMQPANAAAPNYGFGWVVDPGDGSVGHSGTSPGYETLANMIPAEQKAVVVLLNSGSGTGFGENAALQNGITALALGLDQNGEPSRWQQKALFVSLVLIPLLFLASMAWAWRKRAELRAKAKSGPFGLFSLWFPLVPTLAMVWIVFGLVPGLFGVSMNTLRQFQPDLVLALVACAATGLLWAVFRLALAYIGKRRSA